MLHIYKNINIFPPPSFSLSYFPSSALPLPLLFFSSLSSSLPSSFFFSSSLPPPHSPSFHSLSPLSPSPPAPFSLPLVIPPFCLSLSSSFFLPPLPGTGGREGEKGGGRKREEGWRQAERERMKKDGRGQKQQGLSTLMLGSLCDRASPASVRHDADEPLTRAINEPIRALNSKRVHAINFLLFSNKKLLSTGPMRMATMHGMHLRRSLRHPMHGLAQHGRPGLECAGRACAQPAHAFSSVSAQVDCLYKDTIENAFENPRNLLHSPLIPPCRLVYLLPLSCVKTLWRTKRTLLRVGATCCIPPCLSLIANKTSARHSRKKTREEDTCMSY